MRKLLPLLMLCLALPALADDPDWKGAVKQQAGQQMEKELNLAQPSPSNARAYIIEPKDGAEVTSPVKVVFGLSGMGVAPAGINKEGTGHFHLLIDDPIIEYAQPLPATDQIRHFGNGQIETTIDLKPGKHTLRLLLADWKHQPQNPAVRSEMITINVK
jgi:hypothetical protein